MCAPISGEGRPEDPIHRWAAERTVCSLIGGSLVNARARLNERIAACACGRSPGQGAEIDDCGRAVTHPSTEVAVLERLSADLERVVARFQTATSLIEVRYASDPIDIGRAESRHKIELALVERARTLASRFDNPGGGHDVLADLESDLAEFKQMLDAQAVLLDLDEREGPARRPEGAGAARPAQGPGDAEDVGSRRFRADKLFCAFGEHLDALRQVVQALQQIDHCIAKARGDPLLQEHWRGFKRYYRAESHRLTRLIGEEAVRLEGSETSDGPGR